MGFPEYRGEQRQNIRLSNYAYGTIRDDMNKFSVSSESGFINTIIENYNEYAECSISRTLLKMESAIKDAIGITKEARKIADRYLDFEAEKILKKVSSYASDVQLKVSINNRNAFFLTGTSLSKSKISGVAVCEEDKYYKNDKGTGKKDKYIKALLEEYALLPEAEREKVYFRQFYTLIEEAIKNHNKLEITTSGVTYIAHPYVLQADYEKRYNYVAGFSRRKTDPQEKMAIYPFRLSRIANVRVYAENFEETYSDKEKVTEEIRNKGIQFVGNKTADIRILLTPEGQRMYNQIVHQRPAATNNPGKSASETVEYIFDCSEMQAEFYFLKFGAEAIVIQPRTLKEKFKEHHRKAFLAYDD